MKKARKVALLNVFEYPREKYSGYPEIQVQHSGEDFQWAARIYSRKEGAALIAKAEGLTPTKDEADTAAQKWVLDNMNKCRVKVSGAGTMHSFALVGGPMYGDLMEDLRDFWWRALRPMLASLIAYATATRTTRMTAVRDSFDAGSGAALIRIYNGTRPATGGTATTLGAELTCSDPSGTITNGVLTFSAITADSIADNNITATWFRIVDSAATFCMDGNVGTSGADLNMNTTTITAGTNVSITGTNTITDGSS